LCKHRSADSTAPRGGAVMSGSISLSAMQMRQIDRYFRASMLKIL
jgi:hypothetical protein